MRDQIYKCLLTTPARPKSTPAELGTFYPFPTPSFKLDVDFAHTESCMFQEFEGPACNVSIVRTSKEVYRKAFSIPYDLNAFAINLLYV